jgi:hypothetical protein
MFLITLHLIQKAKEGRKLPIELPQELIMSSFDKQQQKDDVKKSKSPLKSSKQALNSSGSNPPPHIAKSPAPAIKNKVDDLLDFNFSAPQSNT